MRFPPWLSLEGMAIQKKDNILYTRDIIKQKLAIPILLSIEEVFGSFHVKSTDFWPFFHGPPPILLKFGTLVGIV